MIEVNDWIRNSAVKMSAKKDAVSRIDDMLKQIQLDGRKQ